MADGAIDRLTRPRRASSSVDPSAEARLGMNFRKLVCPKCSYWKIYLAKTFVDSGIVYKCPKCKVKLEPENPDAPTPSA
jgi:predicted RNA-binding Zn-ribbon protein involved in translation (DUF1610 family)